MLDLLREIIIGWNKTNNKDSLRVETSLILLNSTHIEGTAILEPEVPGHDQEVLRPAVPHVLGVGGGVAVHGPAVSHHTDVAAAPRLYLAYHGVGVDDLGEGQPQLVLLTEQQRSICICRSRSVRNGTKEELKLFLTEMSLMFSFPSLSPLSRMLRKTSRGSLHSILMVRVSVIVPSRSMLSTLCISTLVSADDSQQSSQTTLTQCKSSLPSLMNLSFTNEIQKLK